MPFFRTNRSASFFQGWLALAAVMGVLIVLFANPVDAAQGDRQVMVAIRGLSCPVCAHRLEKALTKLPGAKKAQVDLQKSQAVVDFGADAKVTDKEINQRIRDAGFVPGKVEWRQISKRD